MAWRSECARHLVDWRAGGAEAAHLDTLVASGGGLGLEGSTTSIIYPVALEPGTWRRTDPQSRARTRHVPLRRRHPAHRRRRRGGRGGASAARRSPSLRETGGGGRATRSRTAAQLEGPPVSTSGSGAPHAVEQPSRREQQPATRSWLASSSALLSAGPQSMTRTSGAAA